MHQEGPFASFFSNTLTYTRGFDSDLVQVRFTELLFLLNHLLENQIHQLLRVLVKTKNMLPPNMSSSPSSFQIPQQIVLLNQHQPFCHCHCFPDYQVSTATPESLVLLLHEAFHSDFTLRLLHPFFLTLAQVNSADAEIRCRLACTNSLSFVVDSE